MDEFSVAKLCLSKVEGAVIRSWDVIRYLPIRLFRVLRHLVQRIPDLISNPTSLWDVKGQLFWLIEFVFLVMDFFGVSEAYETTSDLVKFNTRPLNRVEKRIALELFGSSLPIERIRIDEAAFIGPRFTPLAYVGFYTINCWGGMSMATFVHELVHVWQYHQQGATYIPRALAAQYSEAGYNYGGVAGLQEAIDSVEGLGHFNLEQQGDVVADYYRLKTNGHPRWVSKSASNIELFEKLILPLRATS